MLACLVAVPLAAVFGSKLSELGKQAMGDRWERISSIWSGNRSEARPCESSVQPGSAPLGGMSSAWSTPPGSPSAFAAEWPSDTGVPAQLPPALGGPSAPMAPGQAGGAGMGAMSVAGIGQSAGAIAVSYNEQAGCVSGNWPGQSDRIQSMGQNSLVAPAGNLLAPAGGQVDPATPVASRSGPANPVGVSPVATTERFTFYQQRLQQFGVVYSLLENWGERGQLYRFCCKVAVGGNPNYTRWFEATDADPLAAMGKVTQQVERWRTGAP